MNEKKAKVIRHTLRREGTPPAGVAYASDLPYLSSPVVWSERLRVFIKGETLKPLRLHPSCGRFKYKFVKKHLVR